MAERTLPERLMIQDGEEPLPADDDTKTPAVAKRQVSARPMELYIVRLSAPCRAVWLYLLQHDLPHVVIDVDADNASDTLGGLKHKEVPILIDNGITVFEGPAILRYLATAYTNFLGFGFSMSARMTVESLISWANSELHRVVGFCYAYPSTLDKYRLSDEAANEALIESGIKQLSHHLEHLEKTFLSKTNYLTGERLTVADSYVATVLMQAEWVGFKFQLWPCIESWLRRVRAQDYWGRVHQAHHQLLSEADNAVYNM